MWAFSGGAVTAHCILIRLPFYCYLFYHDYHVTTTDSVVSHWWKAMPCVPWYDVVPSLGG